MNRATCRLPAGVVASQEPRPGARVPTGDTVVLTVARTPAAATCVWNGPARDAARRLRASARSDAPVPAFAEQVRVMQGNLVVLTLGRAQTGAPDAWTMPDGYAERTGLNLLDWLAGQRPLVSREVPPYFCPVRDDDLPRDLLRRLAMSHTLVTTGAEACMQVGAVQVWVDSRHRIEAVNLLLGSP